MTVDSKNAPVICSCRGTGKVAYVEPETEHVFPNGTLISGPTYGSRLCVCRLSLSPREGKAQWWDIERVFTQSVATVRLDETIEVTVDVEVPISEDNYRVHRRGNRYWPTLIDVDGDLNNLHPHTAHQLAAAIAQAATIAEDIDRADTDACGHWAPCDCKKGTA